MKLQVRAISPARQRVEIRPQLILHVIAINQVLRTTTVDLQRAMVKFHRKDRAIEASRRSDTRRKHVCLLRNHIKPNERCDPTCHFQVYRHVARTASTQPRRPPHDNHSCCRTSAVWDRYSRSPCHQESSPLSRSGSVQATRYARSPHRIVCNRSVHAPTRMLRRCENRPCNGDQRLAL